MPTRKLGINLVVIVAVAALFTGLWALYNRPVSAPDWPEQISGFSFSPFRAGQSPMTGVYPSDEQIRADLELLSRQTDNIRTYSVDGKLADIPRLAEEFGLRVTLGVWISNDLERNEREIAKAIELANESRSVVRVTVGNESLFRQEVEVEELIGYIDRVRSGVKVPVSTSEQWHIWQENPELAKHVDLIAAHVLPYWEFVPMEDSGEFVLERAKDLRKLFPKKPLLLSEVGWPSNGRTRGGAEADQAEHGDPPLREAREHHEDAVAAFDAGSAEKVGGLAAEGRDLAEGVFMFGPGSGIDPPEGGRIGALLGPLIDDVGGEVEELGGLQCGSF